MAGWHGGLLLRVVGMAWLLVQASPLLAAVITESPWASHRLQPRPSVVLTLDDHVSMHANQSDGMESDLVAMWLDDPFLAPGNQGHGLVPAVRASRNTFQLQMRSPQRNRLYYDPAQRYLPWAHPAGGRWPDARPEAILWDPIRPELGTWDVTRNRVDWWDAPHGLWCTAPQQCVQAQQLWYPGLYYLLRSGADPALADSYEEWDVNDPLRSSPMTKSAARLDCVADHCSQQEERQNFANWAQYHRARWLVSKAGVLEALADEQRRPSLRLGLAFSNGPVQSVDGEETPVMRWGVRDETPAWRQTWMEAVASWVPGGQSSLPEALVAVGRYFNTGQQVGLIPGGRQRGSPWESNPSGLGPPGARHACRRAAHIWVGSPSDNSASFAVGNVDGLPGPVHPLEASLIQRYGPLAQRYVPSPAFADEWSNTTADLAKLFEVSDLAPDLPNLVVPRRWPTAATASWQHLNHYTVQIGQTGLLPAHTDLQVKESVRGLAQGTLQWPQPSSSAVTPDLMFHVAVGSGGWHTKVSSADQLTLALRAHWRWAGMSATTPMALAYSGERAEPGLMRFVSSSQAGLWAGEVTAQRMQRDAAGRLVFDPTVPPVWQASAARPAAADRTLQTWDRQLGQVVPLDAQLSPTIKQRMAGLHASPEWVIQHLRGEASVLAQPGLRSRLGAPYEDFGGVDLLALRPSHYPGLRESAYLTYVAQQGAGRQHVAVGSAAGMLHLLSASDGVERWGYLPYALQTEVWRLADPDYGSAAVPHRMGMAGPMVQADVQLKGVWRHVLAACPGVGGRSMVVLDVTDMADGGAAQLMWDLAIDDEPDLGHCLSPPEFGHLNGRWMAFFGNGVGGQSPRSQLLALDLETGQLQRMLVDAGGGGLTSVRLMKDTSQQVRSIYAADHAGRLWRLQPHGSTDVSQWHMAFGGHPLFRAQSSDGMPQSFSVAPAVWPHPQGGQVLVMGTGRSWQQEDVADAQVQSLYGIWDPWPIDADVDEAPAPWDTEADPRTPLLQQAWSSDVLDVPQPDGSTRRFLQSSALSIDWQRHRGWVLDLNWGGGGRARVISPLVRQGEWVWLNALEPRPEAAPCEDASRSIGMLLRGLSGASADKPVWDTNGDGRVDGSDASANAVVGRQSLPAALLQLPPNGEPGEQGGVVDDGLGTVAWRTYCVEAACRVTDRTWRRLRNPPQWP